MAIFCELKKHYHRLFTTLQHFICSICIVYWTSVKCIAISFSQKLYFSGYQFSIMIYSLLFRSIFGCNGSIFCLVCKKSKEIWLFLERWIYIEFKILSIYFKMVGVVYLKRLKRAREMDRKFLQAQLKTVFWKSILKEVEVATLNVKLPRTWWIKNNLKWRIK